MKYRYLVEVAPGIRYDCLADPKLHVKRDDIVIVRCDRYLDSGKVVFRCKGEEPDNAGRNEPTGKNRDRRGRRIQGWRVPVILRHANLSDKSKIHENQARENTIFRTAQAKIARHKLAMKLITCHCSFDRKLMVLQFTAEGRVDFRELVQDLNRTLHSRVELRQIGVRDEAAIHGGLGCCGRPFCCGTFLKALSSVNVKMAKDQGLSLNPNSISGACGRLKCCLRYEADGYREMRRGLLRNGSRCETPQGTGKVLDTNVLTGRVRVRLDEGTGRIEVFPLSDVERPARGQ